MNEVSESKKIKARWLVIPIIGLVIINYAGAAFHPTLAVDQPLVLIAMNSRNYHLTLVAGNVTFWSFMIVGSLRLLLSDPLFYLLGAEHGEAGKRWLNRQIEGSGKITSKLEQWFPKISWLLVFAAPNNIICLLAGVTGMSKKVFAALNVTGTVGRLLLIWWFADRVQDQLSWVLDFFSKYKFQLTAFTIAAVGLQIWMTMRKDSGQVQDLIELEHDIEATEDNPS